MCRKQRAGNGTRTRDPNLGKVVLYQLSYSRDLRVVLRMLSFGPAVSAGDPVPMEARGIEPLTS